MSEEPYQRYYQFSVAEVRKALQQIFDDAAEQYGFAIRRSRLPEQRTAYTVTSDIDVADGDVIIPGDGLRIIIRAESDEETFMELEYIQVIPDYFAEDPELRQKTEDLRKRAGALRQFADELPQLLIKHLDARRPRQNTDALFQEYYRLRGIGKKITLDDLAEKHGYNKSYLRRLKTKYDIRTGRNKNRKGNK